MDFIAWLDSELKKLVDIRPVATWDAKTAWEIDMEQYI